jgi:hypothetical protein
MTTPAIAPFVSAISVMLGAYGFFYNAYKSRIDAGFDTATDAANNVGKAAAREKISRARNAAVVLAIVPLIVFALLAPQLEDQLFDGTWDLDEYSTLDVLFVALTCAWLAIALVVGAQAGALQRKLGKIPA